MGKGYFRYGNYDTRPYLSIKGKDGQAFKGYDNIIIELKRRIAEGKRVFVCDLYPGVDKEEVRRHMEALRPALVIDAEECMVDISRMGQMFSDDLTGDPVFGRLSHRQLEECFLQEKLMRAREKIRSTRRGVILILGVGAGLVWPGEICLYFDMARRQLKLKYQRGMANWRCENQDAPMLEKQKRGYFVEWPMADRHKCQMLERLDYLVDANDDEHPGMITGEAFREALVQAAGQPFRVQPYFEPGVWGGHWMQENFGLKEDVPNYAWCFDGVPEENSLNLRFGEIYIEIPCSDLVFYQPRRLLGERVFARFGMSFPIRFDLLDTMGGGNLSLQVHPTTAYIQEVFGMYYTQDESYYILDCGEDSVVYLGLKEDVDPTDMERELRKAQKGEVPFDVEAFVNRIPVKRHDHLLIPAGTVHCSGADTLVLEISATPSIFTFKLWDWGRVDLDGKPRPIHLDHGLKNIQWDRTRNWVEENLIGRETQIMEAEGVLVERTGLHRLEFIDTFRLTLRKPYTCIMDDSVHVLNLVDGEKAMIESPAGEFEPVEIHYAETFIIPAAVKTYRLIPAGKDKTEPIKIIVACVR